MAGTRSRKRGIRLALATGVAVALARALTTGSRRRATHRSAAFGRAAEGIWPPIPTQGGTAVRVDAARASGAGSTEPPASASGAGAAS